MLTAIFQTDIKFEDKEYNLAHGTELIKRAAEHGVSICFFPEMSFTGFSMNISHTGESDDYTINRIKKAAVQNKISVGFGYTALKGGKAENHYAVVNSRGKLISDYIKIHSFAIGGEKDDFISGNELPNPFTIDKHNISTYICYDLRFPEIFRASADLSSVMTVAANWPKSRREHWLALLKARAIENQVYVIGINCCGRQGNICYSGDSMVINPFGDVIAAASSDHEEMIIADIAADTEKIRSRFPVLQSRKQKLYRELLGE
ncbi:MAG: carbon-nitrogen family hydrolase [Oscillospiraceae bacterium]|nr:carbon-nitrogen family hydrolase [Oscillospiraceae bacterium]